MWKHVLARHLPDETRYARLATLAAQDRAPATALSAIVHADRLQGRLVSRSEHKRGTLVMRAMLPDPAWGGEDAETCISGTPTLLPAAPALKGKVAKGPCPF